MRKSLSLSLLVLTLIACSQEQAGEAPAAPQMPPAVVSLTQPEAGEFREQLQMVGSLAANQSAMISAELNGVLEQVHVRDGQTVKAGQLLFTIDGAVLKAEQKRAQASVQLRQIEMQRLQSLLKRKAVSQYDLDKANTELQTAQADLELADAQLAKAEVKAPFSGVLGIRKVNQGSYLQAGSELIELVQLDPMLVDFQVPETALAQLQPGSSLTVELPALQRQAEAQLTAIEPALNQATRSVKVRAAIANADGSLRPGLFARILLPVNQAEQVLWIPESALFYQGEQQLVMINNDGKAQRKSVDIAGYADGRIAVRSGLSAEDQVVTAGHHKMPFDGMPMMPAPPAAPEAEPEPAADADAQ